MSFISYPWKTNTISPIYYWLPKSAPLSVGGTYIKTRILGGKNHWDHLEVDYHRLPEREQN